MTEDTTNKLLTQSKIAIILSSIMLSMLFTWHIQDVHAATTTTTVEANIVSSINIVAQNGVVFGDISTSSIAGTVSIDTSGSRTATGGVTINTSTTGSPANFEVSGVPNGLYDITLPLSVVITSAAGDSMTVDNFNSSPNSNGQLDAGGTENLSVAARLNVGSFQPFGAYSGLMTTTVEYN
ncbi:MAG: DUF4402 domain-containing protein [Gammaproteobacteria bacterium]|nr:DUF4402 domain-containing protein [Gammaproteobacteria bacterium]